MRGFIVALLSTLATRAITALGKECADQDVFNRPMPLYGDSADTFLRASSYSRANKVKCESTFEHLGLSARSLGHSCHTFSVMNMV